MKFFKLFFLFSAVTFSILSCSKSNDELLVGTWNEVETGESIVKYTEEGTYFYDYDNGNAETGKWRIEGKTLYTQADGTDEELEEELTILDDSKLVITIGGLFQTTYEKAKE